MSQKNNANAPKSTTKSVLKQFRDSDSVKKKSGSGKIQGSGDKICEKKIITALK